MVEEIPQQEIDAHRAAVAAGIERERERLAAEGEPDNWALVRSMARAAGRQHGEWAGMPVPVRSHALRLERRYPFANLNGMVMADDGPQQCPDAGEVQTFGYSYDGTGQKIINRWYSQTRNAEIVIYIDDAGRRRVCQMTTDRAGLRLSHMLGCLGASDAWSVAAEERAVKMLETLITPRAARLYRLTGSFLESSPRSHVTYLFRKLRPTIAMCAGGDGNMRILSTLCLHPIGYYNGSWAGCMVPTDDVIAHLVLMRGDEAYFWRKANHHDAWSHLAGV